MRKNGYTVTELLVGASLALVVAFFAGSMIFGSLNMSDRARENIESQNELNSIQYHLRSLAARGINVRYRGAAPLENTGSSALGEGYVRSFSFQRRADFNLSAGYVALMYFNVESAISSTTLTQSRPRPTGVFFQTPTHDGRQPGRIVIVTRDNNGLLNPAQAQLVYEGVVGVRLMDPQFTPANGVLQRITLEVTMRYFTASSSAGVKIWCGPTDTAAICGTGVPYRDISRQIVLSFDNNQRSVPYQAFEFGTGIYYFDAANVKP